MVPTLWSTLVELSVKSRPAWQSEHFAFASGRPERVAKKAVRPSSPLAVCRPVEARLGLTGTVVNVAT